MFIVFTIKVNYNNFRIFSSGGYAMLQSLLIIYFTKLVHIALLSCHGFQPRIYVNYMLYSGKASPQVLLIIELNRLLTK